MTGGCSSLLGIGFQLFKLIWQLFNAISRIAIKPKNQGWNKVTPCRDGHDGCVYPSQAKDDRKTSIHFNLLKYLPTFSCCFIDS